MSAELKAIKRWVDTPNCTDKTEIYWMLDHIEETTAKLHAAESALDSKFLKGYVCACATLVRSHGYDSIAEELLGNVGGIENIDWSQIDEFDREALKPEPSATPEGAVDA